VLFLSFGLKLEAVFDKFLSDTERKALIDF